MCFHSSQVKSVNALEQRFDVKLLNPSYRAIFDAPSYHLNGFSHPNMLVIPQERANTLVSGVWGLVPEHIAYDSIQNYHKESIRFGSGLNARSEKLFEHFIYKRSIYTRRCVIPVTGFYEPHQFNSKKYPYYIHRKDNNAFGLAGIYSLIDTTLTFSILTKKASLYFEDIHNVKKRQPVILNLQNEKKWLHTTLTKKDINTIVNSPNTDKELEAYTVSKDLFKPQIDSNISSITSPVIYPELARLF